MSEGSDNKKNPLEDTQEMQRILTEKAPGFLDRVVPTVDLWNDVTPQELSDVEPTLQSSDDDAQDFAEGLGDGPFAHALDAPDDRPVRISDPRSPSAISKFALAASALAMPVVVEPRGRTQSSIRLGDVALARRNPSTISRGTELVRSHDAARNLERRPLERRAEAPSRERSYPLMRALLKAPEEVPYGAAAVKPKPPPVPGTFIPASKRERERPMAPSKPGDLDEMLATMAEGLLIGEDSAGHTEVRVTLRDEFFAGTELRIRVGPEGISAILVPPDRGTYLTLNGNIDDLRLRLESRGLKVSQIQVSEP